jgi:uncharacterized protein
MSPVSLSERIEYLDVLRGAALFGILAANMRAFNSPLATYVDHSLMWTGTADRIVQGLIDLLISGKFITLFSLLFGIGFAVQMDRAADRGVLPGRFYLRRLTFLLCMGLAHAFFLWWGDVLYTYALMGFLLYLFRKCSQRTLLIWSATLYCWPLLAFGAMVAATAVGAQIPMPERTTPEELQRIVAVYSGGAYSQIFQERLKELAFGVFGLFFYYLRILGIFLFGLWLWRTGFIRRLGEWASLLRRCRNWGFLIGLLGNAAVVAIMEIYHPDPMTPSALNYLVLAASSIGVPALSLAYASTLALLLRGPAWQSRLRPFAAIGRTALTNYLLQTVVCTTLYYSWGLGLYGKVGPLVGLVVTLLVYTAQIPLSRWWLHRHNFGPMEWIWRVLTYGRLPSGPSSSAAAV